MRGAGVLHDLLLVDFDLLEHFEDDGVHQLVVDASQLLLLPYVRQVLVDAITLLAEHLLLRLAPRLLAHRANLVLPLQQQLALLLPSPRHLLRLVEYLRE